ncbi:nucleotidyltransferase domain-containing protein [Calditrichota bacterium GD2]
MKMKKIKLVLNNILIDFGVTIDKMYLFGSRAGEKYGRFSDYDILVVTKQDLSIEKKKILSKNIRKKFAQLHIDLDILIKSSNELKQSQNKTGSVIKQAIKEGILL